MNTSMSLYNDVVVIYPMTVSDVPNTPSCAKLNFLARPGHLAWMCRKGDIERSEGALLSSVGVLSGY